MQYDVLRTKIIHISNTGIHSTQIIKTMTRLCTIKITKTILDTMPHTIKIHMNKHQIELVTGVRTIQTLHLPLYTIQILNHILYHLLYQKNVRLHTQYTTQKTKL